MAKMSRNQIFHHSFIVINLIIFNRLKTSFSVRNNISASHDVCAGAVLAAITKVDNLYPSQNCIYSLHVRQKGWWPFGLRFYRIHVSDRMAHFPCTKGRFPLYAVTEEKCIGLSVCLSTALWKFLSAEYYVKIGSFESRKKVFEIFARLGRLPAGTNNFGAAWILCACLSIFVKTSLDGFDGSKRVKCSAGYLRKVKESPGSTRIDCNNPVSQKVHQSKSQLGTTAATITADCGYCRGIELVESNRSLSTLSKFSTNSAQLRSDDRRILKL